MSQMEIDAGSLMRDIGLGDWYSSLSEEARRIVARYSVHIDASMGARRALLSMSREANRDENHRTAALLALQGLECKGEKFEEFLLREELITALVETNQNEEAKNSCLESLEIVPEVLSALKEANQGKLPSDLACRNRLVDIIVGVEGDYDGAEKLMDRFVELGVLDESEAEYRKRSLKIHRLQRSFDSIYSVRFKG